MHDVGKILTANAELYPAHIQLDLPRLAEISLWLRKERELSFYGDIDFIPTLEYDRVAGERAMNDAAWTVERTASILDAENG